MSEVMKVNVIIDVLGRELNRLLIIAHNHTNQCSVYIPMLCIDYTPSAQTYA